MFYILITCNTKAAVAMILNKDLVWISKSLTSLELWNGQIIPPIRCTWLTCLGVPLNVWVAQTFRVNGKLIPIRVSEDSPTSVSMEYVVSVSESPSLDSEARASYTLKWM